MYSRTTQGGETEVKKIKENLKKQGFLSWLALIVAAMSVLVKLLK